MKKTNAKKTKEKPDIYERDECGRITGERPEFRNRLGHHMGRNGKYGSPGRGYELLEDGSYLLAPSDRESIEQIINEIESIQSLINSVWDHAQKQYADACRRKHEWFENIANTLYLEPEERGELRYMCDGVLKRVPSGQEEKG
jgi:hypothetical protein